MLVKHIGVTGNIGSGKSTVCRIFEMLGMPVFYADTVARKQLDKAYVISRLASLFGQQILDNQRKINRRKLADLVFSDPKALGNLNAIVHPLVHDDYQTWINLQNSLYTIYESAILFSSGRVEHFTKIVLVTAPEEIRIKRVCERDHVSKDQVIARMNNQMAEEEMRMKADYTVINDGDTLLIPQVLMIDSELRVLLS
jgi:dephospho-CoA kinase